VTEPAGLDGIPSAEGGAGAGGTRMGPDEWWAGPGLVAMWERVRSRLERTGGTASGAVVVEVGSREQRHAVGDLLGRTLVRDRVRVDLALLERRVVERTPYPSLAGLVEVVTRRPLRDRAGERHAREARRGAMLEAAQAEIRADWVETWLNRLLRTGLLSRVADGEALVRDAAAVVSAVLDPATAPRSRVDLAARVLGDSHALDEDRTLHAVVLRALAAASGEEVPESLSARRALWERYDVTHDLVSATCLTLGLRPTRSDPLSSRLRLAADAGDPVHVTARDLRRAQLDVAHPAALVCENPRVLEAVADRFGGTVPVVCGSGQPNTVVVALLERLRGAGSLLRYHGDFDWPGISIGNRLTAEAGVVPWQMTADVYEAHVHRSAPELGPSPVEPSWDPELGAVMRSCGRALHEESMLDSLLEELARGPCALVDAPQ
jgi:uncharacterized protein (TIGR02679 family)